MKTMKYLWMLCVALIGLGLTSCKDDDDSGSQSKAMRIDKVFLQDVKSSVPDREVDFARLGQLIRIQGEGFKGLKKIYINGYDTYFNNALLTDNNVWVTLNTETPVETADDAVRNTIRLVKDQTETVYAFTIRASSPSITSMDNTMPRPGETVTVYGSNLQETTSVTLPGGIVVNSGIENDEEGKWFSFVMPDGVTESGAISSEGANGTAMSPEFFNDFRCFIIDFEENGKGALGSWSATCSPDELVDDPLGTGRGKVATLIPESDYVDGVYGAGKVTRYWATAGNDEPTDDWNRMTAYIPGNTPVSELAIQMDVYVDGVWSMTGQFEISLQNNLSTSGYGSGDTKPSTSYLHQAGVWVPWLNADGTTTPYETGKRWVTVTIPFNTLGNYSDPEAEYTFQNVIDDRNAGSYRNLLIFFVNNDLEFSEETIFPSTNTGIKIYIDNLRVVKTTAQTVSDFPEE